MNMEIQEELNGLREMLNIHKKNLNHLEIQKAKFGALDVPGKTIIAIEDEEKEIQRLTKEIQGLEQPERLTPELQQVERLKPELQMQQNINVIGSQGVTINQVRGNLINSSFPPQEKKPITELLKELGKDYEKRLKEGL